MIAAELKLNLNSQHTPYLAPMCELWVSSVIFFAENLSCYNWWHSTVFLKMLPSWLISKNLTNKEQPTKTISYLGAIFINTWGLAVVEPCIIKHQPYVIHIFPGVLVLASVQLTFDCGHIHGFLHNIIIILKWCKYGAHADMVKYIYGLVIYYGISGTNELTGDTIATLLAIDAWASQPVGIVCSEDAGHAHVGQQLF